MRSFANAPGGNEGKTFVGMVQVSTDASGLAEFTFEPSQPIADGQSVTATVTSEDGNTSEYSLPVTVR